MSHDFNELNFNVNELRNISEIKAMIFTHFSSHGCKIIACDELKEKVKQKIIMSLNSQYENIADWHNQVDTLLNRCVSEIIWNIKETIEQRQKN